MHIKVGLPPFLLMNLYLILLSYNCTATILSSYFRNVEVESNDGSHLESLGALGPGRILKIMCTRLLTAKRLTKYSAMFFSNFNKYFLNLCSNSDQTLSKTLHLPGPSGDFENLGLSSQHFPRHLANVNAWKTMFDPYINILMETMFDPYINMLMENHV